MKVLVHYDPPPIPIRKFDFCAYVDGYEEGFDGRGGTAFQAVLEVYDSWEAIYDETLIAHRPGFLEDL